MCLREVGLQLGFRTDPTFCAGAMHGASAHSRLYSSWFMGELRIKIWKLVLKVRGVRLFIVHGPSRMDMADEIARGNEDSDTYQQGSEVEGDDERNVQRYGHRTDVIGLRVEFYEPCPFL